MAKARITNRLVESAKPAEYWDTDIIGFKLIVSPAGHRSFAIEGRLNGRKVKHSFGRAGAVSVEQARKRAKELLFAIVEGRDPAHEAASARKAWTVKELVAAYRTSHLPNLRPPSQQQYNSHLDRFILPELGHRRVVDVEPAEILSLFRRAEVAVGKGLVGGGKTTANRVLATASGLFREACALGLRTDNPCRAVRRNPEFRRERYLSRDETARLLIACDATRHVVTANLIRLLVFTGARKGEALCAQWNEFDLELGIWSKPSHHTKQKRTHSVPLSLAALALLRDMRHAATEVDRGGEGAWLFPGAVAGEHLVSPKRAVTAVFRAAGLGADVCLHTLRHSFAARVVSAGHGLHAAGKLLGHTQATTTHRYAHLEHDAQRRALGDVDAGIRFALAKLQSTCSVAEPKFSPDEPLLPR